ncbi:hypothetical protein PR048_030876 [Dryococelus australis]|uniref:Uncharacterized protein n=1 Tax=Dryococelus australis TaxID=614101 RepID=A0ABQ9GA42_9NEOP|nr:hypothetical protein PR048_030876 [Dryococelus australis]
MAAEVLSTVISYEVVRISRTPSSPPVSILRLGHFALHDATKVNSTVLYTLEQKSLVHRLPSQAELALLFDPATRGNEATRAILYSLMYKYADINRTLVVCCRSGRRRLDTVLHEVSKHRVDPWLYSQHAWLAHSPPIKAIRARSPEGPPPDPRMWESCWTMSLAGGLSRGTPASPSPEFQRRSILGSHFIDFGGSFNEVLRADEGEMMRVWTAPELGGGTGDPRENTASSGTMIVPVCSWFLNHATTLRYDWFISLITKHKDYSLLAVINETMRARQWRVVKCCKVSWCLLSAVHCRCTQQEPVTTVHPGGTERIPTNHKRAARDLLTHGHAANKKNNIPGMLIGSKQPKGVKPGSTPRKPTGYRKHPRASNMQKPGFSLVVMGRATVAERLACSLPTKPKRVQSPAGSLPDFRKSGNRSGRYRRSVGFLGDLPFPPPLHSGAASL